MDIYKHKWTKLQASIFSLLCLRTDEKLSQREIARLLKVSPTSIAKALEILKKDNLITSEKIKNINFISLNREGKKALELKRVENLKNIYASGLSEYLEREFAGCTIILFGSYSYGEDVYFGEMDDRNSDIDIAIIGTKGKEINLIKFEKILEKKIVINFYKSWKKIHRNLKNNILNGIILAGGVEL